MAELLVVKIQRSIHPPDGPYLIYDESREKIHVFADEIPDQIRTLTGSRLKFYALAFLDEDGSVRIKSLIEDQPW